MRSIQLLFTTFLWFLVVPMSVGKTYAQAPAAAEQQKRAPFESEIAAFEAADKKIPPPTGAVLFVGSSSIRLWTTLQKDFPELKLSREQLARLRVEKFGPLALFDLLRLVECLACFRKAVSGDEHSA